MDILTDTEDDFAAMGSLRRSLLALADHLAFTIEPHIHVAIANAPWFVFALVFGIFIAWSDTPNTVAEWITGSLLAYFAIIAAGDYLSSAHAHRYTLRLLALWAIAAVIHQHMAHTAPLISMLARR